MRDTQFFNEATGTLMDRHRTTRRCRTALARVSAALTRRTSETAANRRMLEPDQVRRKSLEASLKSRHDAQAAILKESLRPQDKLRQPIWRMIVMQDRQRRSISDRLQDEIAQSMIGTNIGLSFLKAEAEMTATRLKGGITRARKQIRASLQEFRRITSVDPKP
jgi:signal transduction histidine kinase